MRKGKNPAKLENNSKVEESCFHQVIVPVHLPELSGYYKEGLDILKFCLESIILTVHPKTFISVINNGSCFEVEIYINRLYDDNKIQEAIHTSAIGKISAIAKGLSGHSFELVTITDADVLFTNGWQKAVYEIYGNFPKTGVVCTTPQSRRVKHLTENLHFDNVLNKNLKFRSVESKDDLKKFAQSIGNEYLFNQIHLENILSIEKSGVIAVAGAGHYSATYKTELVKHLKQAQTSDKLSSKSDKSLIDIPSVKYGHWRLSTYKNYTYHLGNHFEDWMQNEFNSITKSKNQITKPKYTKFKKYRFTYLKSLFVRKVLYQNIIWNKYLRVKGLNYNEAKNY